MKRDNVKAMQAQRQLLERACEASLSSTEWRVLGALMHQITSYGWRSQSLSHAKVAEVAGVSVATARRALDRLVALGLIEVDVRGGRGRGNQITIPEASTK